MPVHDDLNSTNSNGEKSAIINKIPGIHLDDNEKEVTTNVFDKDTNYSNETS